MPKTISLISLGCFRNTYDSNVVVKSYLDQGYVFKADPCGCDLLIVNTCGFINRAKEEAIDTIRDAVELKDQGKVNKLLVMGCLVQRYRDDLEKHFPQVDSWQGVIDVDKPVLAKSNILPGHLAFLKICEGCINKCSYCAIPLIKGPLKSRSKKNIIDEVKFLNDHGIKELNIIGQDITAWGIDTKEGDLAGLVKSILKAAKDIPWVRLIYTHPRHFSDSLIELVAGEEKICKYIDLPIQHINSNILKLMNRAVSKGQIITLLEKIRKTIPDVAIRSSIICGFPTETELQHQELMKFLGEFQFERLGAFIYSREEGTVAYDFKQVHHAAAKRRHKEIMMQQQYIMEKKHERMLGRTIKVLIEEKDGSGSIGRSQHDAYEVDTVVHTGCNHDIGHFYDLKITQVLGCDLVAG